MEHLHREFDLRRGDVVEVNLAGNAANVLLLDPTNYAAYRDAQEYRYFGGYFQQSPVRIRAPQAGRWHLVIDLGGGAGSIQASGRVISGTVS